MRRVLIALPAVLTAFALAVSQVAAASPSAPAGESWTRIASGLHNPRGVAVGPDGNVYVALAGIGAGSDEAGVGPTGEVIRILHPRSSHARTESLRPGLTSLGGFREGETVGPDGISVDESGRVFVIMAASQMGTGIPDPQVGALLRITQGGDMKIVANVGDRDYKWTTNHMDLGTEFPDADPYGVFVAHGKRYVVDAASNTLNRVRADGRVQILAYFPQGAVADAVPTCVTEGPDGALYIGTLSLVDSLFAGPAYPAANVWRVDPAEADPHDLGKVTSVATQWATGFWPIHGCSFDGDGNLWVSEIFTSVGAEGPGGGALVKVNFGDPDLRTTFGEGFLNAPGGVAVDAWGHVYVSNNSTSPSGTVLRLDP